MMMPRFAGSILYRCAVYVFPSNHCHLVCQKLKEKQMQELKKLQLDDLSQFAIKGSEEQWKSVLASNPKGAVSLKR